MRRTLGFSARRLVRPSGPISCDRCAGGGAKLRPSKGPSRSRRSRPKPWKQRLQRLQRLTTPTVHCGSRRRNSSLEPGVFCQMPAKSRQKTCPSKNSGQVLILLLVHPMPQRIRKPPVQMLQSLRIQPQTVCPASAILQTLGLQRRRMRRQALSPSGLPYPIQMWIRMRSTANRFGNMPLNSEIGRNALRTCMKSSTFAKQRGMTCWTYGGCSRRKKAPNRRIGWGNAAQCKLQNSNAPAHTTGSMLRLGTCVFLRRWDCT
mmetsp:Transcript_98913/g.235969  ORF Transcript_98913/g.235969 Transcript_98913/m.235969 type:complete len:261 (-) Transcript_98913:178-960(-)